MLDEDAIDEPAAASCSVVRGVERSLIRLAAGVRKSLASRACFSWASAEGRPF